MAQLTCELCNGTDFVKEDGLFVCQSCGCKYSVEDAQRLMQAAQRQERREQVIGHTAPAARPATHAAPAAPGDRPGVLTSVAAAVKQQVAAAAAAAGVPLRMETLADFRPDAVDAAVAGARAVNNYACQAWQLLLAEYGKLDHPGKPQQESLAARAVECLALLDGAAKLEPANHPQGALIYANCRAIERAARDTHYYEEREDGRFVSWSMPFSIKLTMPGQKDSWEEKERAHRTPLEEQYVAAHPEDVEYRTALEAQKTQLEAQLDDLKDEKKGHKLFDFSGKREVKDRMKPLKEELAGVNTQLRALDQKASDYADACIGQVADGFIRL